MQRHDPATDRPQVRTALLLAAGLGEPAGAVDRRAAEVPRLRERGADPRAAGPLLGQSRDRAPGHRHGLQGRDDTRLPRRSFGGIAIEYLVSPLFATTNNIYSLWLARHLIDEPFLLAESDVVFDEPLLAPLLQPDRIAVSRQLPWMSGTTVTLDADGNVDAFYPPPPGVYGQHCRDSDHFMAVNICSLARDTWGAVCERLDFHVAAGRTGGFYESVFEEMTAHGSMALTAVIFPTERWYEIDTPADRDAAELVFPGHLHVAGGSGRPVPSGAAG